MLLDGFAFLLSHGAIEHLDVEVEPQRRDVAVLAGAQELAGAADLQVRRGQPEARAQLAELLQSAQALARGRRQPVPRRAR